MDTIPNANTEPAPDAATNMEPLPQPTAMTSTHILDCEEHQFRMYKEQAIIEI